MVKTIDGEYEVIEYHDSPIPTVTEQMAEAMRPLNESFRKLGEAAAAAANAWANFSHGRRFWIIREMPIVWPEPLPPSREPHHFHLLERHIRSHRRKRR